MNDRRRAFAPLRALRRRFNTVGGRLLAGTVAIHAVLIPLLFGGVLYLVERGCRDQFLNQVRSDSYLFAALLNTDLTPQRAQALIDDALVSGRVQYAQLALADGTLIAASAAPVDGTAHAPATEDFAFGEHGDGVYYMHVPLHAPDLHTQAELRLGYSEATTRNQIAQAYRRGAYIACGYLLLSIALATLLARSLGRPLQQLRAASRRIAQGHSEQSLHVDTRLAEIQSLSEDLNLMRAELVHQATRLQEQALHDALTGLPNRALLHDRLSQAASRAQRDGRGYALLLLDLDHFKEVNDALGHAVGDVLLKEVATRLASAVRASETLARLGGDEFAIVLAAPNAYHAERAATRVQSVMAPPFTIDGHVLRVAASIGIALCPAHSRDLKDWLRKADIAMYEAKRRGVGFRLYDAAFGRDDVSELAVANELRVAIEEGQLVLHYQPKVAFASGRIAGAEALVRWHHPTRGLLTPDQFIPLAEKTGLIEPLTDWVLATALRDCRGWADLGAAEIGVAINLSARSAFDQRFVERTRQALLRAQIPPGRLELELTETAVMSDPVRAHATFTALAEIGVGLAVDDFGTGYSSLAHLHRLPIRCIKIDKSFVIDMLNDDNDAAIVDAIVALAHNLGIIVVAEGVENAETYALLKHMRCDYAQGMHLGPPLPAAEFLAATMHAISRAVIAPAR